MKEVYVISAVRTPIGNIGGALKNVQPDRLLQIVFDGALEKAGVEKTAIDEVIAGQTKQSTDFPNIARVAALMSGIPESIPAYTVHRQCASGMQALLSGAAQILCGASETVLCGGVESMSTAPFYVRGIRHGVGTGNTFLLDPNTESQPKSQPESIYGSFNMLQTADAVAHKYAISREACDEFALASQQKAVAAADAGRFRDEIVPVPVPQPKGSQSIFDTDEYPRRDADLEKMAKLKPIFTGGVTTAGNASGRNDGASALLLMEGEKAKSLGLKPLARLLAGVAAGVDPRVMGIGPVASTQKLLKTPQLSHISLRDFDLIEINEAFASQSLACAKELGLKADILNVNGGAIALGHPLGMSGARICTTLLHEMGRRGARFGLATICVAGGLGMSMAFEKPEG
ncbi:MAG: thiolase family protein [Gracilibacteraceae bacterium]|jgi:acetyl-CoA C-acetyltransferase|nr:thiolase family protein [Gracilibacteraceae bacterium]